MKRILVFAALMVGLLAFSACAKEVPLGAKEVESSVLQAEQAASNIKLSVQVKDSHSATFRLTDPELKDSYKVNNPTSDGGMREEYAWKIIIGDYEIWKQYITDMTSEETLTFDKIPNMLYFHTFETVADSKNEVWKDIGFESCTCKAEGKDIVWTIQFPADCKIDLMKAEEFMVNIYDFSNPKASKDIRFKAADVVTKAAE